MMVPMLSRRFATSAVVGATLAAVACAAAVPADAAVRPERGRPRTWRFHATTPTVVKTPAPSPSPAVTPSPTALPSPTSSASPTPTAAPTPTATATATATTTPSPTPAPTPTLIPTPTPVPAPEPTPQPTPQPVPEPTPEATPSAPPPPSAPSGQTTTADLLPPSVLTLSGLSPDQPAPWVSYAGAGVGVSDSAGRTDPGALAVSSAGPWTGATSQWFRAVPGARYTVTGYALGTTAGATMALGLRFRNANGAVIAAGTQLGQGVVDDVAAWTALPAVIGFAPAGAVRGELVVISTDAPVGQVHDVDDLTLTQTTGTAAPLVGPLTTSGRDVLDALGRKVTFRGIHLDGMQSSSARVIPTAEVVAAHAWGANLVRLPLNENFATPGDCAYDPTYLSRVDTVVDAATRLGMLVLIDLHTNAVTPCAAPTQQSMPDAGAVQWWQTVAARYASNPLVAFDLYNEPHDVSDTVWRDGGTVTSGGVTYTAPGMQALYDAVRGTGATNLVFASGPSWANSFPVGAPLRGTTNLVYAAHAYTCPLGTEASGATCKAGPSGVLDPSGILSNFDRAGAVLPVVVTEFGWPSKYEGRYITNVIDYATSHGWSGWDVFAFDGTTGGMFDLVKDVGPLNDPAISGMAVMTRMLDS